MYDKIMLTNYVLKIKGKKGRIQMNNKFIKLTLALVMALSVSVPAMAAPTDVPTDETEITATPVTTTGAPNSGQENTTDAVALSKKFSDINTNDFAWARPYINDMTEKGYISGYVFKIFNANKFSFIYKILKCHIFSSGTSAPA